MEEKLENWLKNLDRERLENIAFACIDYLIDTDTVRYYPDEKEYHDGEPYWETNGEKLDE